jgi:hypothetical protein
MGIGMCLVCEELGGWRRWTQEEEEEGGDVLVGNKIEN